MSIECTFKTQSKSITLDLEDYIGSFTSFVLDLNTQFELDAPVDIDTFFGVVDSDYFNSMEDVRLFLGIKFAYGYLPKIFLTWVYHTGNSFNSMNKFNEEYKGHFHEPKDFCKKYIDKETQLNTMPTCVTECVDYQKMWDVHLSNHFYSLKVENDSIDSVTMYTHAIFTKTKSNTDNLVK